MAVEECVPKVVWKPHKAKNWLSEETLSTIKKKRRLYRRAKKTRRRKDLRKFRCISNTVRELTRRDHITHAEQMAEELKGGRQQKPFWRWLKNLHMQKENIPQLEHKGMLHRGDREKAEVLNDYFQSVFTEEEENNLTAVTAHLKTDRSYESLENVIFTEEEVLDELSKLDVEKAPGPDSLPGRLLRESAPSISAPLAKLFTKSMDTGCLPTDWKSANVTPILKGGNKHLPINYRPVSLTSLIVKTMERLIQKMVAFLEGHKKLNSAQHGFRAKHSCLTQQYMHGPKVSTKVQVHMLFSSISERLLTRFHTRDYY